MAPRHQGARHGVPGKPRAAGRHSVGIGTGVRAGGSVAEEAVSELTLKTQEVGG